jgi:hypothetical protein
MANALAQYLLTILEDTIPCGWHIDSTPDITTTIISNNLYSYMSISIHGNIAYFYNNGIKIHHHSIQLTFADYEKDKTIVKSAFDASLAQTLNLMNEPARLERLIEANKRKDTW